MSTTEPERRKARYLGTRVPSEPFSLTWGDFDWERGRIRLPSPKTAVHGKPPRTVSILPEVRPLLEAVWEAAPEGATHVFAKLREWDSSKAAERGFWASLNLRQHLLRLIDRAGLKPWLRLWHNLRSSAQTDLADRLPGARRLRMVGQHEGRGGESLPASDGRSL